MKEPTQFELFRTDDPVESALGAAHIIDKISNLHSEVLEIVRQYPGRTASELAEVLSERDSRRIGRRLPELENKGLVFRTVGVCTITNRPAARWYENSEEDR